MEGALALVLLAIREVVEVLVQVQVQVPQAKVVMVHQAKVANLVAVGAGKGLFLLICSFFDVAYLHL
jgi:hypothetical protein